MDILIDASILIEVERDRLDLTSHVAGREADDFFLSVITVSELLHGVHRAKTEKQRARRRAYVELVISRFPILNVDLAAACFHARLSQYQAKRRIDRTIRSMARSALPGTRTCYRNGKRPRVRTCARARHRDMGLANSIVARPPSC